MRDRNKLLALARALLYCPQTVEAHLEVLRGAFLPELSAAKLQRVAARSHTWSATRPQPRAKDLVWRLHSDPLLQEVRERHALCALPLAVPAPMRTLPGVGSLPAIRTERELAEWLRLDPEHVQWFADLEDRNRKGAVLLRHYVCRTVAKADGSVRLLEAPMQRLKGLQRQILQEILGPVPLHEAVHGFRAGHSIVTFAAPHAGRPVVLRMDLREFFPSISGRRVQALFRTLGYPERVADLLGGLCTTTTAPGVWRTAGLNLQVEEWARIHGLYARPHLPQGAPTSPALANLCAFRLDRRLAALARAAGAVYTRYADDLAFSGEELFGRTVERFSLRVAAIVAEEGFHVHARKSRVMRASVRQHLAGLTVNRQPHVPRRELDRLEAVLTNCVRYGPASQNREDQPEFRRHLEGKVAFVAMVGSTRVGKLRGLLERIEWS